MEFETHHMREAGDGKKLRILVAEGSNEEITSGLRAALPASELTPELTTVSTVITLLMTIRIATPDVIFLDLSLAHPQPIEAVKRVHRTAPGIPLVIFADAEDKSYAAQSLAEGAVDYILKDFLDGQTLQRVLQSAVERSTPKGQVDPLRDPATGLYNRDGFLMAASRNLERLKRGESMVLVVAKLESATNPGEPSGTREKERQMQELAKLLRQSFRRTDIVGRIGEERCAALAIDAAEPSAAILRKRVETRIEMGNQGESPSDKLRAGIAVKLFKGGEAKSIAEMLEMCDAEAASGNVTASAGEKFDRAIQG